MTSISDDMVERGAIGLDAALFVRDKYYDHPNVVIKRNNTLETSRIVLTAALEGSVAVPALPPSLVSKVVAAMAQRVQFAHVDAKEDARADFNEVMKWADAAEAVTRQDTLPPDWKQDQAETSRLPRKDRGGAA